MFAVVTLKIDLQEKHVISPYLYMQFMEPLGTCDASVDAAWDFTERKWYDAVVDKVRFLAPTMIRFGGCFASYYHWKEGVGPQSNRVPMLNYCWNGMYYNQVGTHEIIDFCRRVKAEPLLVVNMESDGRDVWAHPKNDTCRLGTAEEAAEWVDYCNNPNNALRRAHGITEPYGVKYWQIGNETSYFADGYKIDTAVEVTKRFAAAMRKADPHIVLTAWGDSRRNTRPQDVTWCQKMSQVNDVELLAFHHHFNSGLPDSPLTGTKYRDDFEATWAHMMHAHKSLEIHIDEMRAYCGNKRLAMTECHYALPGRNRCEVLSSWAAGVSYARCHNVIMRNSDILDIATMADFFGNVWQVNAVMIPTPIGSASVYLQPVGAVMRLFGHYQGKHALNVSCNGNIDAVASKTGNKLFIHAANTDMHASQDLRIDLNGVHIADTRMHYIAADPRTEITPVNVDCFDEQEVVIVGDTVTLPPAAVAAIEMTIQDE